MSLTVYVQPVELLNQEDWYNYRYTLTPPFLVPPTAHNPRSVASKSV